MTSSARPFAVERAAVAGGRYHARPDDRAELEAIWRALRDIPRENLASKEDLINYLHRCAGRIPPVIKRLETVAAAPVRGPRTRLAHVAVGHAAIVEGVFGKSKCSARDQTRMVESAKGRRVRVVELGRCSGQLEFRL